METAHYDFPETKLWVREPTIEEKEVGQTKLFLRCPCCRTFVAVCGDIDSQNLELIRVSEHINSNKRKEQNCVGSGKTFLQFKEWMDDKPESDLEKITGRKYIWYIRLKMDEPEIRTMLRPEK